MSDECPNKTKPTKYAGKGVVEQMNEDAAKIDSIIDKMKAGTAHEPFGPAMVDDIARLKKVRPTYEGKRLNMQPDGDARAQYPSLEDIERMQKAVYPDDEAMEKLRDLYRNTPSPGPIIALPARDPVAGALTPISGDLMRIAEALERIAYTLERGAIRDLNR